MSHPQNNQIDLVENNGPLMKLVLDARTKAENKNKKFYELIEVWGTHIERPMGPIDSTAVV